MRTHKTHAPFHILLLGLLWTIGITASAADRQGTLEPRLFELHTVKEHDGLVTAEPRISQKELNHVLAESKHLLSVRSHKLEEYIEENRITGKTGVMAAVMPGGLIYLAVRKARLSEANVKLENLKSDTRELQTDILALHEEESPLLIARFP
jgi:hypothetical protein